ncbi:MAG: undecaprenyl-diphosphatase UppP [Thermoleophilia bacterium]|nr:undecaprenyl-diphosphatase UppP [Thermoleophilia bacterium]
MSAFEALILGLLQGLTEFLPISSSGHLVVVPDLLGWEIPSTSFDIVLHLGTLAAVLTYFWRDVTQVVTSFFRRGNSARAGRRLGVYIALGTVPGIMAGGLLADRFEALFEAPLYVAIFLIVTGLLLVASEAAARRTRNLEKMRIWDSLLMGAAQALAITPGISRSGATISAGLFLGLTREAAARFSFLLSIPIIAGAAVFKLGNGMADSPEGPAAMALGFLAAAVAGFAAIKFLMKFIRRHDLRIFAYYVWALAAFLLVYRFAF